MLDNNVGYFHPGGQSGEAEREREGERDRETWRERESMSELARLTSSVNTGRVYHA